MNLEFFADLFLVLSIFLGIVTFTFVNVTYLPESEKKDD
jgi:hypothetical protein